MSLSISDFVTDHRFIILIDIRDYSELSDDQQLKVIQLLTNESQKLLNEGGYQKENLFASFIPTGDGFYMVGDKTLSLFWSQMCLVFAVSLRNALLTSFSHLGFPCNGIRIAIHFGTTETFTDIAGHENYVGAGMNETARLLSPFNLDTVSQISHKFIGHQNYVIISELALAKAQAPANLEFRTTEPFTIQAKHGKTFSCRLIDRPSSQVLHVFSLG